MRCRKPSSLPLELLAASGEIPRSPADTALSDATFLHFRRKVRNCDLLSASTERLLGDMSFCGKVTVTVHEGHVLKSGYEEGYFHRKIENMSERRVSTEVQRSKATGS